MSRILSNELNIFVKTVVNF